MRIKDPTAWMDDLTVFVDDETVSSTAALLEPTVLYRGSKAAAALWFSVVGVVGGAFGAVTLSSGVRHSVVAFALYAIAAAVILRGLGPLTARLLDPALGWLSKTTFFWAVLLAWGATGAARVDRSWLAYGVSAGVGLFIGLMYGSLNPTFVKREETWMGVALPLAAVSTLLATAVHRTLFGADSSVAPMAIVGSIAGGLFTVAMSLLLMRLWNDAHGLARMAVLFLHNDNFAAKAVTYLDAALALDPDDPELYNLRGVAWSKLGEPGRAAEDWSKSAELSPKDAGSRMNVGVDLLRRGEIDRAVAALEAAVEIDPRDATVHSNLGAALERRGDFARAIEHYGRAIALRPDYANAYSNRGYARFRNGDLQDAVADCERALELEPRLAMACVNRGHALAALGERERAAASYQSALDLGPSPEVTEEALRGLEELGVGADADGEG